MDVSSTHQDLKTEAYWKTLVSRETSEYRERAMDEMLGQYFTRDCSSTLEVGCGTSEVSLKYKELLQAEKAVCIDYDEKIIEWMKSSGIEGLEWRVADIFNLDDWHEKFDMILLLDMVHEVYSFYGRQADNAESLIDHERGLDYVTRALTNLVGITSEGGGMIVADDLVCLQDVEVRIQIKTQAASEAILYFLENYPSKLLDAEVAPDGMLRINSRDFCILLTQYNKIKRKDWDRWNVERLERHQYMTVEEYKQLFAGLGCDMHMMTGTPEGAYSEWASDFEILDGLDDFPDKRVTLLAVKK